MQAAQAPAELIKEDALRHALQRFFSNLSDNNLLLTVLQLMRFAFGWSSFASLRLNTPTLGLHNVALNSVELDAAGGGLDELAPVAVATVATVRPSGVTMGTIDPFELGFTKCTLDDLKGGDRAENAKRLR